MAILLEFRKTGEDERQVEYIYGFPEMNRRLVIDKASLTGSRAEGTADPDYASVLWKILQGQQKLQAWPEAGAYAA